MASLLNTYKNATGSGTGVTVSSVAPSGTDRALYVQVAIRPYTVSISSVVFNTSENAVLVDSRNITSGNTNRLEVWRLTNPTATTASVVVTASGTASLSVIASTWEDVPSGSEEDASTKDGSTGSTTANLAGTITWGGGSDVLFLAVGNRDTSSSWTADAGVSEADVQTSGTGSTHVRTVLLTDTDTETGKVLGTFGSSVAYNIIGFNINSVSVGGSAIAAISSGYHQQGLR